MHIAHALARAMIGVLSAPSGCVDGKAGIEQITILRAGARGVDWRMLHQPYQFVRLAHRDVGDAVLHEGDRVGIGQQARIYDPFRSR